MPKTLSRSRKIASTLWLARNEKDLEEILEDLLTPAEVKDLEERIAILEYLLSGETQRATAQKLRVSISKVSRGALLLQSGNGALARHLE